MKYWDMLNFMTKITEMDAISVTITGKDANEEYTVITSTNSKVLAELYDMALTNLRGVETK